MNHWLPYIRTVAQIIIYGAIAWIVLDFTREYWGRPVAWAIGILMLSVIAIVLFLDRKKFGRSCLR
jgi:hypothetical protein